MVRALARDLVFAQMKVAFDAQLAVGTATGIGEYSAGWPTPSSRGAVDGRLAVPRLDPWRFDRRVIWDQSILPRRAAGAAPTGCTAAVGYDAVCPRHDGRRHGSRLAWLRVQAHTRAYARWYFGTLSIRLYCDAAA